MTGENEKRDESAELAADPAMTTLSTQAERFSILSSDIRTVLSDLSLEVNRSLEQLRDIRQAVDLKREELKTLCDIETSAVSLNQLVQDHRLQRENMERLMESRRAVWEEEKARIDQEQNEYLENLRMQRQREADDHRRTWAAERLKARETLEEELRAAELKSQQTREAIERDLLQREQVLREKELECARFVEELERFMSSLKSHARLPQAE